MAESALRKHFREHGWVHVKKVFPVSEIEQIREKVIASIDPTRRNGNTGDILSNPQLRYLLYDDRFLNIIKEVLPPGQLAYFGDSGFLYGDTDYGAFHKDNADRNDQNAPDWDGEYDICRAGIYLDNHVKDSGGLLLRDKSLNTTSIKEGRSLNVPIEIGDLVVWNLRTTHSGNAQLFKIFPNFLIDSKYYRLIPSFFFRQQKRPRGAIFISIGREGKHLQRYMIYQKTRRYIVSLWKTSKYDPEVIAEMESHGLKLYDLPSQVKDLDLNTLNEQHKDIPY
jgi:hypothetical protein